MGNNSALLGRIVGCCALHCPSAAQRCRRSAALASVRCRAHRWQHDSDALPDGVNTRIAPDDPRLRARRAAAPPQRARRWPAAPSPSSDRWAPNLVSASDTPTTLVLVLQKDEYEAWLGEQAADTQSYLKAAGLAKFKDDALVLLPECKWAFMTKNASSLYAFASLPARLPSDGAVYELESAEPLPATAALSWGLGCYSFDACKGTGSQPKADDPPKFASLVVPAAADDYATSLKGTASLPRPDQHAGGGPGARGAGAAVARCVEINQ